MREIVDLNELENVIHNSKDVIVLKFFADWCGPCKSLTPILEEIESERSDINFIGINIEEAIEITNKYNIRSVPTLIFIKDNEVKERSIGLLSKDVLLNKISELFN